MTPLVLGWLACSGVAEARDLTLRDALGQATQTNLELASGRRDNRIAELGLASARSGFDPNLSVNARTGGSQTPTNNAFDGDTVVTSSSRSVGASLNQALPTGGNVNVGYSESFSTSDSANASSNQFVSTGLNVGVSQPLLSGAGFRAGLQRVDNARLALASRELAWRAQLEGLVIDVAEAYWGLVQARQARAQADRAVARSEDQLRQTEERQAAGFAGSGDVLRVRVSLGTSQQQQVSAVASEEQAEDRLARVLGLSLTSGGDLSLTDRPVVPESLPERDAMLETARNANVTLLQADLTLEQSVRNARLARNGALPNLSLDGNAGVSAGDPAASIARSQLTTEPAPFWSVGVSTSLPLFLRSTRAEYGMAQLRVEQAELAREAADQDLELSVDNALRALRRDRAGLKVAEQTLEAAEASLAAQEERLAEGRGSTRDVVEALELLQQAEANTLSAQIQVQLSGLRAQRVEGTLLDSLGLAQLLAFDRRTLRQSDAR